VWIYPLQAHDQNKELQHFLGTQQEPGRRHQGDARAVCNLPAFIPCRAIPHTNLYDLVRKQSQKMAGLWLPQL